LIQRKVCARRAAAGRPASAQGACALGAPRGQAKRAAAGPRPLYSGARWTKKEATHRQQNPTASFGLEIGVGVGLDLDLDLRTMLDLDLGIGLLGRLGRMRLVRHLAVLIVAPDVERAGAVNGHGVGAPASH